MKTVTLTAHLEGQEIKLDEPYEIPSEARLLVTVLPSSREADERTDWSELARPARNRWLKDNPY